MRKASAKVVLNRAALSELHLAWAEGVEEICRTIIDVAEPNDAPPFGQGLVDQGGWLVYADGKKVGGGSRQGVQPKKPRAAKTEPGITGIVGWGFPARFHEMGTSDTAAYPFFTPAAEQVAGHAARIMKSVTGERGFKK
jgi:hypothetical protein